MLTSLACQNGRLEEQHGEGKIARLINQKRAITFAENGNSRVLGLMQYIAFWALAALALAALALAAVGNTIWFCSDWFVLGSGSVWGWCVWPIPGSLLLLSIIPRLPGMLNHYTFFLPILFFLLLLPIWRYTCVYGIVWIQGLTDTARSSSQ